MNIKKFFKSVFYFHRWVYRNPHDRTCKICGKHEVEHYSLGFANKRYNFWDVWVDGDEAEHYKDT